MRVCPKLLCSHYSPSVKATTIPMNAPFAEADLASHKRARTCGRISTTFTRKVGLLWTCVCSVCLLRLSSAYATKKDPKNQTLLATRKLRIVRRRIRSNLVLNNPRVPKKACTKKHCDLCKKHGGAYTMHNTCNCRCFEKDGTEKSDFTPLRKAERNPIP